MKLPTLKHFAPTSATVQIADGTDENGALKIVDEFTVDCRVEQKNEVIYLKDGRQATLKLKAFIFEKLDKFPAEVSGFCTVFNYKYDIAITRKVYNPDGSMHHVVLELV